jgi:predicted nucleic acid-binding protein
MALFLDTGFVLALEDTDDQHHQKAKTFWSDFRSDPIPLITTSYIFDETVTLIRKHLGHARAVSVAQRLRTSPLVTLLHLSESDFDAGWDWFERYADKKFSFTDCTSFAVMKRLKVKTALSFDKHFTQAGFDQKP